MLVEGEEQVHLDHAHPVEFAFRWTATGSSRSHLLPLVGIASGLHRAGPHRGLSAIHSRLVRPFDDGIVHAQHGGAAAASRQFWIR